jgi:DNA helicase-2/ATP-dependent DNA helicase PcrA
MFYTYDLGPAQYETPSGMRDVELVLKRQYEVEDGKLIYAYDTDSSMHDSILGEVLSQSTDNKLRVIIGSIQKEQNEAIRSRADRNCLIYGLAGSGKTSVGLHK